MKWAIARWLFRFTLEYESIPTEDLGNVIVLGSIDRCIWNGWDSARVRLPSRIEFNGEVGNAYLE